jgi:hypothetical protein
LLKGVDGFCICGVSYLYEKQNLFDKSEENENKMNNYDNDDDDNNEDNNNDSNDDSHTIGLPENAALMYRFRKHIDAWVKENNDKPKYAY